MEYPEKEEGKVLVGTWITAFDKSISPDLAVALGKCDIVYALDLADCFTSLKRRVYSAKAAAFPDYVNNNDSAIHWLIEKYGEDGFTYVSPEQMASYAGIDEKVMENLKGYREELERRMPDKMKMHLDGLAEGFQEMQFNREEIFKRYIQACREQDIGPEQCRDELELYIKKGVPAAELLAPVTLCKELRDGMDGMPDFDPMGNI